tara:strand:+ start:73 stop:585 length:513 start_codon:yes stop_codon:yes gene_type:complete
MKKLSILLASIFLLASCASSVALLGPATGVTNGKVVQSSLKSVASFGVKQKTGSSPMQHVLTYATKMNPNKKKERCISFVEKTNSEACMIAKKQISLVQSAVSNNISNTQKKIKVKVEGVISKTFKDKSEANNLIQTKTSPKMFFLTLRNKVKKYDKRWRDRIERSSLRQ